MATQNLISIIVPVYKVEQYIDECLESIIGQTYQNIEVILVDDGSPDRCPLICDEWAKRDQRIHVIHQKNAGVSAARNTGMKAATGGWIVFVDSDDQIAPETIECAWKLAAEKNCDTVCWNCYKVCDGEIEKYPSMQPEAFLFQGSQEQNILIEALYHTRTKNFYPGYAFRGVCGKMLSAAVIKKYSLLFPVDLPLGEDAAFLTDYFSVCSSVLLVNRYWYFYRRTPTSAVGQYRENLKEVQMMEYKILFGKIHGKNVDVNTVLVNQLLQFDYQFIHHLYQKKCKSFQVYKKMLEYINRRNEICQRINKFSREKVHKKSIPVAWAITRGHNRAEALLCMLREKTH